MAFYSQTACFPKAKDSGLGYVLNFAACVGSPHFATAGIKHSTNYISLIDTSRFSVCITLGQGSAHDSTICDLQMIDFQTIASCSRDGSFRLFDIRQPQDAIWIHQVSTCRSDAEVNSISVYETTLAVTVDSVIALFDIRQRKCFFEYSDLHHEPVTKLRIVDEKILISAGEDGLINIVDYTDLKKDGDGQTPIVVMNPGEGIRSFSILNTLICSISSTEAVSIYNLSGEPYCDMVGQSSFRDNPLIASDGALGYILNVSVYDSGYSVLCGSNSGTQALLDLDTGRVIAGFSDGHSGVVRASMTLGDDILTGGEDGKIILWSCQSDLYIGVGSEGSRFPHRTTINYSDPY
jgi:WD40 repeat protein